MKRYKYIAKDLFEINEEIDRFDTATEPTYKLQRLYDYRDNIIKEINETSLFQWLIEEIKYYPKHIYYTIADRIAEIKYKIKNNNINNDDEGEYPF